MKLPGFYIPLSEGGWLILIVSQPGGWMADLTWLTLRLTRQIVLQTLWLPEDELPLYLAASVMINFLLNASRRLSVSNALLFIYYTQRT